MAGSTRTASRSAQHTPRPLPVVFSARIPITVEEKEALDSEYHTQ